MRELSPNNVTMDMPSRSLWAEETVASETNPGSTTDPLTVPRNRGILIEMSGANAGQVHPIEGMVMTLGRGRNCTLAFQDVTLSRVHARIVHHRDQFVLTDMGSLNGCFVNHVRVKDHQLEHGDRLRLGSGVRFQFQRVSKEEERMLARLYDAGVLDGLTGAYNRRHLDECLRTEISHAIRHRRPLSLLLLDVDYFKRINDTHGHLAGDDVLKAMALAVGEAIRDGDLLARYGGEEFAIVVRDTAMDSAAHLAERLRKLVEDVEVPFEGQTLRVTISIGVAGLDYAGPVEPTGQTLLSAADQALYEAKDTGRNRVVCGPSPH